LLLKLIHAFLKEIAPIRLTPDEENKKTLKTTPISKFLK